MKSELDFKLFIEFQNITEDLFNLFNNDYLNKVFKGNQSTMAGAALLPYNATPQQKIEFSETNIEAVTLNRAFLEKYDSILNRMDKIVEEIKDSGYAPEELLEKMNTLLVVQKKNRLNTSKILDSIEVLNAKNIFKNILTSINEAQSGISQSPLLTREQKLHHLPSGVEIKFLDAIAVEDLKNPPKVYEINSFLSSISVLNPSEEDQKLPYASATHIKAEAKYLPDALAIDLKNRDEIISQAEKFLNKIYSDSISLGNSNALRAIYVLSEMHFKVEEINRTHSNEFGTPHKKINQTVIDAYSSVGNILQDVYQQWKDVGKASAMQTWKNELRQYNDYLAVEGKSSEKVSIWTKFVEGFQNYANNGLTGASGGYAANINSQDANYNPFDRL